MPFEPYHYESALKRLEDLKASIISQEDEIQKTEARIREMLALDRKDFSWIHEILDNIEKQPRDSVIERLKAFVDDYIKARTQIRILFQDRKDRMGVN